VNSNAALRRELESRDAGAGRAFFRRRCRLIKTLDYAAFASRLARWAAITTLSRSGPDRFGLVIGDISGKGMPAALLMRIYRELRTSVAIAFDKPQRLLRAGDHLFFHHSTA